MDNANNKTRAQGLWRGRQGQEKEDLSLNLDRFKPRGQIYIGSYHKDVMKEYNPKEPSPQLIWNPGTNELRMATWIDEHRER